MKNKELKKGDRIWMFSALIKFDTYLQVHSVKKNGTLVTVVVGAEYPQHPEYEITLYGHASSSLLSGYHRYWSYRDVCYTCDYELITEKYKEFIRQERFINAGVALLNLVKYFKE